jgi:outer membrane protein assembly factor BamB
MDTMKPEPTRRELLSGLAVAAGTAATGVPAGSATAQATLGRWPMFGYDLGNTGHNPDARGVPADPGPVWGFETDDIETNNAVRASPAVADGRIYVGSGDSTVYALDRSDGSEVWAVETGGPVRSTPAVADGTVYVGSDDETVYAIDAETGEPEWSFDTDGRVRGSPAVADGRIHVATGGGTVYAIDSEGEEVWAFEEPEDRVDTAPALSGTDDGTDLRVYVGSEDGRVYAIDGISGNREWVFGGEEQQRQITGSPAAANGRVYVGGGIDQQVYALVADSGEVDWTFETGGSVVTSPAVVDGRVYVASRSGAASTLHALEGGEERWTFEGDLELTSPAVADGRIYVGSRAGTVYAVDSGGERVWSLAVDTPVQAAPVVAGERLYFGSDGGFVYALAEGGDATVGGDSPEGDTGGGGPPGGGGGGLGSDSDFGFLLFPAAVVTFVATIAGGLYAAHRTGVLSRVEAAADSVGPVMVPAEEDVETEPEDEGSEEPTQVWELVLTDVIERAEQTDRTATQDLLVTKYVDSDTLDSPVVAYEIESYRDDPAQVRIVEPRFESDERDDARPLGDGWELDDDSLVFEATLDPEERLRTIVGRPDCPPDLLDDLLERPEITVEST